MLIMITVFSLKSARMLKNVKRGRLLVVGKVHVDAAKSLAFFLKYGGVV